MMASPPPGVLVIRVWIEPGAGGRGFRARITRTLDVTGFDQVVTSSATPEQVSATVADWLAEYLATNTAATGPE